MPCSPAKARLLLKEKKAIVVRRTPFTIQLTIATGESKQPVSLGVDAGYKHVGLSASTEKAELYASEVELRPDVSDLLSARRTLRQSRRNRKTRYRAPRFDNRIRTKRKDWLAPSVENRINAHLSRIGAILRLLPVTIPTFREKSTKRENSLVSGMFESMFFSETGTLVSIVTADRKIRCSMFITWKADALAETRPATCSRFVRRAIKHFIAEKSS